MSFLSDARIVARALDRYRRESSRREARVIRQPPLADLVEQLDLRAHVERGGLAGRRLAGFLRRYLAATTRLHHPAYLAHQVAVPHPSGSLASMIDGFTNNAMAIYEMGPPAAAIEYFLVNWLLEKVGWTPAPYPGQPGAGAAGAGVLTHGGSLANLTALLAARSRLAPEVWREGSPADLALLAAEESHYSVARAAGIMGIGRQAVYPLEVDERGVIVPDRLPAALGRMKGDGRRAVALVANACSTAVGLYDPLEEIGAFCAENGIWFHVDGAHGASALLSGRHRGLLRGVERADSLVWDAHKLLRVPTLCAAVLVRDGATLDRAFQQEASYLFHDKEQPGFDFIHRAVECTKAGLGLRLFAVLAALGQRGLAGYVERCFELARQAYGYLSGLPGIECPVSPQANILCFRLPGSDELQLAARARLLEEGDFYLSSTAFRGRRYLRLVFMNPDTRLEDVARLVERLRRIAAGLGPPGP
jgi:L-2,4-diaminobutyrate decarboxylase